MQFVYYTHGFLVADHITGEVWDGVTAPVLFEDGGHWEYTFTYTWYDGDYLEFVYDDDGTVGGFTVRIEGDVMYLSNTAVADMPLVRK